MGAIRSREEVGGKAHNLMVMQAHGLPVPPFIALGWKELCDLFDWPENFGDLGDRVFSLHQPDLADICAEITERVLAAPASVTQQQQLLQRCSALFGTSYHTAVRSSALSEDAAATSFAGQHLTELYVTPDNLIAAIKTSIASAFQFGAISYRLHHQIPVSNIQYAVVIQLMVDSQISGVAFSMNANGNLSDAVVAAGYGQGEGIVSDQVNTDTFFVSRATQQIQSVVQTKPTGLFLNQKALQLQDIPAEKQNLPALTHTQILQVYQLAITAEKLLKHPADIEFSINEKNELYMLQMRPVTTIHIQNLHILENTNIVESYPGVTLPLSYTFASNAYETLFRNCARFFWINPKKFNQNHQVFENLIAHYYGRVYYRLDNWYRMMAIVYHSKSSIQAWESAVGLPDSASQELKFKPWGKFKTTLSVIWLILNYRSGNKRFFKVFQENYTVFKAYPKEGSPLQIWLHLQKAMDKTFLSWPLTIVNDYLAFKAFGWLQILIKKYQISENQEFANEIIMGYGEVDSELAVVKLLELKDFINHYPALLEKFQQPSSDVLTAIQSNEFPAFTQLWENYLDRFGDRTLAELKLEAISPRMNPELLVDLLKSQLASNLQTRDFVGKQKKIREQALKQVYEHLKPWQPRYWIFKIVYHLAAFGVMSRENMRFCRSRVYAICREILLEIANKMVVSGHLQQQRDVFYLTFDEVKSYCLNQSQLQTTEYANKVESRKLEFANYAQLSLPDRVMYEAGSIPEILVNKTSGTHHQGAAGILQGVAVSKGEVIGEAIVITEPMLNADVRGKILVSRMTDPGWVFLMSQAIALVTEKGSLLSHTAIVGRELGIPVVVAVYDVTQKIQSGDKIRVNGSTGEVEILAD